MSLAVLRIKKSMQLKETERQTLIGKRSELKAISDELEKSVNEAVTVEDMALVEGEINTHETAVNENEAAISRLDGEIAALESEIADIETRAREAVKPPSPANPKNRSDVTMPDENVFYRVRNNVERKERMRKAFQFEDTRAKSEGKEKSELRAFFEKIAEAVTNRDIVKSELLIPEILINMIEIDLQFVGKITSLVTLRPIGGTTRIIMSGDAPEPVWVEMNDAVSQLNNLEFSSVELDGFKLAGYMAVHNAILEDAFINLAAHVQEQMVKGFRKGLDRVILNGKGSAQKQPAGIIPNLKANHKVKSSPDFAEYLSNYSLLPDDANIEAAIMTRKTYFENFMPQTVHVDSAGRVVVADMRNPILPDGTPVVFVRKDSNMLTDGQVLTGEFSKYFMAQRKGMTIQTSTEVKFLEDQTVFKIVGRFDGKPLDVDYFLLITLEKPAEAGA